jgi:hypothetical protein
MTGSLRILCSEHVAGLGCWIGASLMWPDAFVLNLPDRPPTAERQDDQRWLIGVHKDRGTLNVVVWKSIAVGLGDIVYKICQQELHRQRHYL